MTYAAAVVRSDGFTPPGPGDFDLPADRWWDRHVRDVRSDLRARRHEADAPARPGGGLVFGFFYLASRKRAMVPGKLQFVGETAYGFVRNSIGRDIIGSRDFVRFVPVPVRRCSSSSWSTTSSRPIPFIQFPTFSRSGMVYGARDHQLGHLQRGRHPASTASSATSSTRPCRRASRPDAAPAGPAGVHLQHPGPAGHAGTATVRQHVRRPPAADPVRASVASTSSSSGGVSSRSASLAWVLFIAVASWSS